MVNRKRDLRDRRGEQCSKGYIAIGHHIELLLTASPHIPSPSSSLTAPLLFNTSSLLLLSLLLFSHPLASLSGSLPQERAQRGHFHTIHAQHDGNCLLSCSWKLIDQIASFLSLHHLHRSIGAVESWLLCCKDLAREATIGTYMAAAYGLYFFWEKKAHHKRQSAR